MQITKTVKHINVTMQDLENGVQLANQLQAALPEVHKFCIADIVDELRYNFLACGEADVNYTVSENLELFVELV
ncbi:hypothetical protein PQD09_gp04 [Providencia phage PSTCR4]|uniref:Uncharacterized protein n=1 Tax=Providencia phage PSTCR4 TaxID=2783546 RepID=A0A873WPW0_9CAUD|nr:hypothetical protein PQD09_gp04 [Providencia phage PSTCR4]QPB12025.1 hypothetical protein [Providencia phage PSTCR4]